jgi:hypothetical protein
VVDNDKTAEMAVLAETITGPLPPARTPTAKRSMPKLALFAGGGVLAALVLVAALLIPGLLNGSNSADDPQPSPLAATPTAAATTASPTPPPSPTPTKASPSPTRKKNYYNPPAKKASPTQADDGDDNGDWDDNDWDDDGDDGGWGDDWGNRH